MPRFSEGEKIHIQQRLLQEGERLFLAHGLQKVTIDDLIKAGHIAKASFYGFYESKEHLFLDIALRRQREILDTLHALLDGNRHLAPRERVYQVFAVMQQSLSQFPFLTGIDTETVERIARKVSGECLQEYKSQNLDAARSLQAHGVRFTCDVEVASCAFQALYQSWLFLRDKNPRQAEEAVRLLLDGMIAQIIAP